MTPTNDWTFVSQSFNSGSDTTAIVGFYSGGACFDQVRVTCSPLTALPEPGHRPDFFSIYPTLSAKDFTIQSDQRLTLRVLDLSGKMHTQLELHGATNTFGESLPVGAYIVEARSKGDIAYKKIVKY